MSEIRRFRLLIIGKTGCGKTTILSKVCGEDADRPSTTRGVHDIDRELRFQHNDRLVAHDSEGFEAGQRTELGVVNNFIERRATMEDINERLHMVWYCVEMNSRPIQHAEREFFSTLKKVPVIVVITKFDAFVRDVLQELEEAADEEGLDMDEDELEKQAVQVAKNRFNEYYRPQLQDLPQPPKAIVALSNTNESQPNDSRLSELIKQTMVALDPPNDPNITPGQRKEQHKLRELFVTAQTADLTVKVDLSLRSGMGDNYKKLGARPIDRKRLVEPWNTIWSYTHPQTLFAWLDYQLQRHIDYSPRIIGHPDSHDLQEIWQWRRELQLSAQLEHMVIDSVIIMQHIFLLRAKDKDVVERLIKWYVSQSATAKRVRKALVDKHSLNPHTLIGLDYEGLCNMINNLEIEVPDFSEPSPLIFPVAETEVPLVSLGHRQTIMAKLFKKAGKKRK